MRLSVGRILVWLALGGLIAAACADDIPSEPPAIRSQPTAEAEAQCGWMRWTDDPIALSDWFEAHPETAALHWWDAEHGVFRSARRDALDGASFDSLRRVMTVWQESKQDSGGDAPPIHTIDAARSGPLIELKQGLNLVPWIGGDEPGMTLLDAFRWIVPNIVSLTRWDGITHNCYFDLIDRFEAPRDLTIELGSRDLLAIEVRQDATWTQSWLRNPIYASFGEIAPAAHAELAEQVREVSGFIAARYGLAAEPYAVMLLTDTSAMSNAYRALTGSEFDMSWWPDGACGVGWAGGVGLLVGCREPIAFDHEYVHVIQQQLARGGQGSVWRTEPLWLIEGAAEYFAARYRDVRLYESYHEARWEAVREVTRAYRSLSLDQLEDVDAFRAADPDLAYALSMLAAEWLVAHAGEDALFEFHRQLSRAGQRWRFAFEIAFGMTVDEFYEAFEQHSAEFDEPLPYVIRGVVLDPEGQPVPRLRIHGFPSHGGYAESDQTDAQGRFSITVAHGSYRLAVHGKGGCTSYGHYGAGGRLARWQEASDVIVPADADEMIVIRLPAPVGELRGWSSCDQAEGDNPLIGRVLGPGGAGVSGVGVLACGPLHCGHSTTDASGAFSIDTPEQTVRLMVGPGDSRCEVWGVRGANGVLVPVGGGDSIVELGDRANPIDIILPAPPDALERFDRCW